MNVARRAAAFPVVVALVLALVPATKASAIPTVKTVAEPDSYLCAESGFVTFENLVDQTDLTGTSVAGVEFTTTDGFPWKVGDFSTGSYNGKYPNGLYTSQGTRWAWLGENQGAGRISFVNGPASTISVLLSVGQTPAVLDAYDADGELLETAGPAEPNTGTGTMTELKIERNTADLAYVVVHDSGNHFVVDAVCTDAPGVPRTSVAHVALGDSYSSGEGLDEYFENSACHRSRLAYPLRVKHPGSNSTWYSLRHAEDFSWGFLACSGATTSTVLRDQIRSPKRSNNKNYLQLSDSTALVTVTVGGNDIGFADLLEFCALNRVSCQNDTYKGEPSIAAFLAKDIAQLKSDLIKTYREIRGKAKNARIIVLGYPQLFPDSLLEQSCLGLLQKQVTIRGVRLSLLYSYAEQRYLRQVGIGLNAAIAEAVTEAGVGAEFVPVANRFKDHEVCGYGTDWINGASLKRVDNFPYFAVAEKSFHPKESGHEAYANIINSYLTPVPAAVERRKTPLKTVR